MAHITETPYISNQNIDYLIMCLSNAIQIKYGSNIENFDILIVGGSALALKYAYRSTVDIDADIKFRNEITSCINSIALSNNIPKDWINQDFTKSPSYSRRIWSNALYYKTIGIINVFVVSDIDQLCMKLVAGRTKDAIDAIYLSEKLIASGVVFSTVEFEYKYLYGDYIKPNQRLLSRVKKLFKRAGML